MARRLKNKEGLQKVTKVYHTFMNRSARLFTTLITTTCSHNLSNAQNPQIQYLQASARDQHRLKRLKFVSLKDESIILRVCSCENVSLGLCVFGDVGFSCIVLGWLLGLDKYF